METTKKFKVTTLHDVYEDHYENGEDKHVYTYIKESTQETNTYQEAIQKHFENDLYYNFDINYAEINKEQNVIFYSVLVDVENFELSISELELFKQNKIKAYANNITIKVEQLIDVVL